MEISSFRFDRLEFAGSLGDLGTLIPLSLGLIVITGLSASTVFLMVGLFYVISGLYYRLPIPVQPLKVVAAIAIAAPEGITVPVMAAAGIIFGLLLLLLAATGAVDLIARLFTKPVIRGIQLGLGFILARKGLDLILSRELFLRNTGPDFFFGAVALNTAIGIAGFVIALLLLSSKRFPAAIVVVTLGVLTGIAAGGLGGITFNIGPTTIGLVKPTTQDFLSALVILVIPQIPLTIGNAVMGTADTCLTLFGTGGVTRRATYRAFASSMGLVNVMGGIIGAMPMCHGAGGLAAHYRFGARTGGSNLMIGALFIVVALLFGNISVSLLGAIPRSVLGVLLLYAGLELALLVRDVSDKKDLFVAFLIAGVGLATTNMALAFVIGMVVSWLIRVGRVEI